MRRQHLGDRRVDRHPTAEVRGPGDAHARAARWAAARRRRRGRSGEIGTRGSAPASTDSPSATSSTVRPIGPCTDSCDQPMAVGCEGTRPGVGRSPTTLQNAAGLRSEPPMSLPSASGTNAGGQRRGGPAGGPAGGQPVPVGVVGDAEEGVEGVRAGGELRHVGLARPGSHRRPEPGDHELVAGRHRVAVERRAPGGAHAAGCVGVLVRDRDAVQRPDGLAGRQRGRRPSPPPRGPRRRPG